MENRLLTGKELIDKKYCGPKDFPTVGWREYRPSDTWLEKKQIQACLEDKLSLLRSERIDKVANLATAEWLPEHQKAKVTKKVGKHWDVFGHYKENADWLYPEEALFLIETNVLQLLYGEVPVSVEQGYLLLIGDDVTLAEYRVYSFLLKRGYKVTRHCKNIKRTKYKKQVPLDQVFQSNKCDQSLQNLDVSSKGLKDVSSCGAESDLENKNIENNKKTDQQTKNVPASKALLDDVYVVEDSVEVIEVEDSDTSMREVKKLENKVDKVENEQESILIEDEDDDDDVDIVFVSNNLCSRCWYPPLTKSLIPQNWQDEGNSEQSIKYVKKFKESDYLDLSTKTTSDILKTIGGNTQKNLLFAPDQRFLPDNIETKYSVYKINLHQLDEEENRNNDKGKNTVSTSRNVEDIRSYQLPSYMARNNLDDDISADNPNNLNENHQSFMGADQSISSEPNYNVNHQYSTRAHFNSSMPNFQNNHLNEQAFQNVGVRDHNFRPTHFRSHNYSNNFQPMHSQVNSRNSLLMRACEMQLMAANMMQTASQILAACNRPQTYNHQQMPFVPQNQLAFTSNQMVPFTRPVFTNYPNVFGNRHFYYTNNSNNGYQQRQWSQRYHGRCSARKRPRKYFPLMNNGKNNAPSSSKSNNEDVIVLDSDEEEKGYKRHIKKPHTSANNTDKKKSFPVIDISNENHSDVEIILPPKDIVDLTSTSCSEITLNKNIKPEFPTDGLVKDESDATSVQTSNIPSSELYSQDNQDIVIDVVSNAGQNDDEVTTKSDSSINEENNYNKESSNEKYMEEPSNWEQYKSYSPPAGSKNNLPLIDLDRNITKASVYETLHLFNPIENSPSKGKQLKVSFDTYLPTDHFKKSFKMLPKFRVIVMSEEDLMPTMYDLDALKEFYQDKIPFLFAVVLDQTISFYNYDHISLPTYL
ncbi:putative uncharacterized protein DDB_G0282133 [Cimex lectularius]|uniref:tRNA-splicing endonuclease subunit Sen54 N-terminal domain-containing protein n=1 Tax=Cimex lectularius TaxID=79782 RepID=A0A8I6TBK7_CIMLE|nr:putative uncharacterized protein DDB_G0282133 [Cimex lectularius]